MRYNAMEQSGNLRNPMRIVSAGFTSVATDNASCESARMKW